MSYILDALKKSEQERGHGGIPGVQTVHSSSLNYNNKKTYWPYILITAVLLNLVAILYFVLDKDKTAENNIAAIQANTIKSNTDALTATNNTQNTISAEQNKHLVDTTSITNSRSAEEEINSTSTAAHTSTNNQVVTLPVTGNKTRNNSSQIPTTADRSTSEDNTNIIEFYDLPESIKQQLPAIIISAHVYSTNPLHRSIVINNNFLEEGEYILDDLILYEITADGAIFYYKDIKFHHGVVSGWQ
ncbi:MAG: GspB domain-containing protein [Gammaproteobacteria bacterium]|nr:GspB domain-containing protein [Gammaproteobacteria bacterium]